MNRWVGIVLLLTILGALALRCPQLALRPMHNDEAVNAEKIRDLWQAGQYAYDPNEHHGPTLYYLTLPFVWLSGARDYDHLSEVALRAVSVFFGVLLILLLWLSADALGRPATLVAALLTAVSPAMVFYSRYFIHEMILVWASMLVLAAAWRYTQTPRALWAALAGVGVGLMYATKETFVIALAAMVVGVACTLLWARWRGDAMPIASGWQRKHLLVGLAAAAAVSLLFITSFFTNASGPLDSLRTYAPWLKRAGGASPHIHPWSFYLERLVWFKEARGPVWSEGLIAALALVGGICAFARSSLTGANIAWARFLTFYTVLLTAAYSIISYKTPWCLLGFLQPMILLAGVGAVSLVQLVRARAAKVGVSLLLIAAAAHLGWQAWRASFPYAADRRNPYVYAQTVPDVLNLVNKVEELAKVHADGNQMLIKVMVPDSDYWPLPWYLRQFKTVGWWGKIPADPYAPVMIVGAPFHARFDEKSDKAWVMVQFFELRPRFFLELYVQFELWQKYIESRPARPEQ
jgi:uncharacterized protein (TIGR03663 family)